MQEHTQRPQVIPIPDRPVTLGGRFSPSVSSAGPSATSGRGRGDTTSSVPAGSHGQGVGQSK